MDVEVDKPVDDAASVVLESTPDDAPLDNIPESVAFDEPRLEASTSTPPLEDENDDDDDVDVELDEPVGDVASAIPESTPIVASLDSGPD